MRTAKRKWDITFLSWAVHGAWTVESYKKKMGYFFLKSNGSRDVNPWKALEENGRLLFEVERWKSSNETAENGKKKPGKWKSSMPSLSLYKSYTQREKDRYT